MILNLAAAFWLTLVFFQGTPSKQTVYRFDVASLFEREHISSIAIDNRGLSYFAVTRGILEFDGVEWRRIKVRNDAAISLLTVSDKGRIFVAGRDEFGYLAVDDKGNTVYETVSGKIESGFSGEIVAVVTIGSTVYYFGARDVYAWNGANVRIFPAEGKFLSAAGVAGKLFAMDENRGLVVIDSAGGLKPVAGGTAIRSRIMTPFDRNKLMVVSASRGYFALEVSGTSPMRLEPWGGSSKGLPAGNMITSVAATQDVLAFGTLTQGVLFTNLQGQVIDRVEKADGLFANLALGISFTPRNTLWAGHDNGVSLIEANKRIPSLANRTENPAATDTAAVQEAPTASDGWWNDLIGWVKSLFGSRPEEKKDSRIKAHEFAAIVRRVQFIRNDSTVFGGAFSQEKLGVQDFEQSDSVRYLFDYDNNALRFSYATNDFESAGGIQYQSMLKGLDDDWAPLTTNTFREFTNLDFGDYEFVVRAVNSSGQFSREASFRFEIDPPWHQALWFYFLQISIYISLLVSSYFLNRKGIALGLAEKIVTILVVVTFEYINTYLGPVFDEIAGNIAIFAVGLNIMVALVLEPVQQWYERILKFVAQAQKEREDRLEREQLEQKMTNPNA